MSGASDRLTRLLALVPWLLAHPGSRVADVAAEFGVSERQLRDDLQLVFLCGLPGHGPGDLIDVAYEGDRVTVSNADTIARPLRLTADEALALIVALRALADTLGAASGDAVYRALAKIEEAAGGAAEAVGRVAVAVESEADVVAAVREALESGRALHLRYYVPGRDETTERDVDPIRLDLGAGRPYLQAWCRQVEDVRLFRVDRVHEVRVLDEPAAVPPQARPRDLSAGVFQPAAEDEVVTLEVGPGARWVADYYPCESVEALPGGGLRVRLRTPDTRWLRRLALRLGEQGRVVAPAAVVAEVRREALAALAAYGAA